jgi:actin-like ATPase involved in cell morphogenesis
MASGGVRLGVDFGTSSTAAMVSWSDRRVQPLLFDGSPLMPSAVYAEAEAGLLVGRDAVHAGLVAPERFEPHPKLRIDDGAVLLGDRSVLVAELIAAVLRRVLDEARRVVAADPDTVVLTCPAAWGTPRRAVLTDAASLAGCGRVTLVAEPVAAATYFVKTVRAQIRAGAPIVVYDLGAGTFDASVIRRRGARFDVLATRGLDGAGGLDIDAAVVGYLATVYGTRDAQRWQRLIRPRTPADRRAARQLWDHVRTGKESLSRRASTVIHVPLFDEEAPLGREQLDDLARDVLQRTVDTTRGVLDDADVAGGTVAAVFLVGGGSRMPAAATAVHHAFGVAPTVIEQPELVVAEGALLTASADRLNPAAAARPVEDERPAVPARQGPADAAPTTGMPDPPGAGRRRFRTRRLVALGMVLALLGGGTWAVVTRPWADADQTARPLPSVASGTPVAGAPPSPVPSLTAGSPTPTASKPFSDQERCSNPEVRFTVTVDRSTVRRGTPIRFTLRNKNVSTRTCVESAIGIEFHAVVLMRNGTEVWHSRRCEQRTGPEYLRMPPGHQMDHIIDWDGTTNAHGCDNRPHAEPGTYVLRAHRSLWYADDITLRITA